MRALERLLPFSLTLGLALLPACGARQTPEQPTAEANAGTGETPPPSSSADDTSEKTPPEPAVPDEPWRATPPEPKPAAKIVPPTFEQARLKNGLTVIVARREGLPLVAVHFTQRAGSGAEPASKAGLAQLTYELLLRGAGKRDALELADAFGELGTEAKTSVTPDGGTIFFQVLERNVDAGLALLADVVLRPRLAKDEFERRKKERLALLARLAGNPRFLSADASARAIFGEKHPYGHQALGETKTVERLKLADVKGFYRSKFGPKASALIFAGDVTLEEAKAWARRHFGKWRARGRAFTAPKAPKLGAREAIVVVPKEDLGQTVITVGRPAIPAGHPDEWALRIASSVYGGLFSSRLNMNLREDKGYTYGARAYLDPRLGAGPLVAFSSVRADVTGPSLKEFFAELEGLRARPITEEEFSDAVEGLRRSIPGWFETVEALAGQADQIFLEHQPLDRIERALKTLDGLTVEVVREAATTYFVPGVMRVILVGDPKVIAEQVAPLGLGSLPPLGDEDTQAAGEVPSRAN